MITCTSNPQLVLTNVDTTVIADVNTNAIADVNTNVDININAIPDTGTTGNYLTLESPYEKKQVARASVSIRMPNGQTLQSTHTALLK